MEHLAILSKKFNLLNRILSGEKTIESRWYKFKKAPFKLIKVDENIYFKETGSPVNVKAKVKDTLFFENLTPEKIKEIFLKYQKQIGTDISYLEQIKDKKFCSLIFLKEVKKIGPFEINKKGYGNMTAWITIDDINKLKKEII